MQWVDRDTTTLLADLMRAPDPPPVLLVLAARADQSEPVLELVRRMDVDPTIIHVGPLPESAAIPLALSQLGEGDAETARKLVREADGSPLFLLELTRYLHGRRVDDIVGKGLDAMLAERIVGLGESARLVAEVVAIAGEPVTRRALGLASALPNAELTRQLSLLRAERVVRMSGSRADDTIEPYHTRIRSSVLPTHDRSSRPPPSHLATALSGQGSAEQLARHWYAAGDVDHAAEYAKRAGDEARAQARLRSLGALVRDRARGSAVDQGRAPRPAPSSPTRSPMQDARARRPIGSSPPPAAPRQRPRSSCAGARLARCSSPATSRKAWP